MLLGGLGMSFFNPAPKARQDYHLWGEESDDFGVLRCGYCGKRVDLKKPNPDFTEYGCLNNPLLHHPDSDKSSRDT